MSNELWMVTGATGFIGSVLVWDIYNDGKSPPIAVDHVSPQNRPEILPAKRYTDFIFAQPFIESIKNNSFTKKISGIVHMGACSSTTEKDVDYLRENNTNYTKHLWNFCCKERIPFIYASSGAVYGSGEHGFDDATDPMLFSPLNPYGRSKSEFDIWALQQKETPPRWYGLRFFNVYGPNEYHKGSMSSVVFKAFEQINQTGQLKLFRSHNSDYADGEQMRDFVYVKDISRWVLELINNSNIPSGIFNMGYGQARTWLDLATCVFESMDRPMKIDWIDVPDDIRAQYQYFTEAKMDRLKENGLTPPQWSLERGVKDYIQNHLLNKEGQFV